MAGSRNRDYEVSWIELTNKGSAGEYRISGQADHQSKVSVFSAYDIGVDCHCVGLDFVVK